MTLTEFQSFVDQDVEWFQGVHPETADTIAETEWQLGYPLPSSLVWLPTQWGYSMACGVGSLNDAVKDTYGYAKI